MASGNPFRASQAINPSSRPVPQTPSINTDSSVLEARRGDSNYVLEYTPAPPPKTKKSVRIVSPTTTIPPHPDFDDDEDVTLNELMARRSNQAQLASPPPPVNPAGFPNSTVTAGEANAQMLGRDVMAAPEILPSSRPYFDSSQTALSPNHVPANPFSITLASLEPQEKESREERTSAQRPSPGNHRASLDVESFKNLLLTGKPIPRPSGPPQPTSALHPISGAHFESSSSTDTSSISRQSLFEPPQEIHTESPRTSVEMADEDEDDSMGLVSEVKKGKKKPPPAPKHRHGKLVAQRQPQTVSFDSFAATTSTPPPSIRRTDSSDMNKPLPPTPVVAPLHISTQDITPVQSPPIPPSRRSEPSTPSDGSARQKRAPPPIPLARRQSQLKTSTPGSRSRSSSNLTMNSQHSVDALTSPILHTHDPLSSAKSPPPPPPSRHGARLANLSNSSANSSHTELPQRSSSVRTARSIPDPPSSRRSTMDSEPLSSPAAGVNRTSSMSSHRKVSGGSTGSQMPPPPPPPRRKRESLDQQRPYLSSSSPTESRRTSTEYNRRTSTEHRRASVASESSLRREYAPVDEEKGNEHALYSPNEERENQLGEGATLAQSRSDSSNILDDMEKFQQEIEELRLRTRTGLAG